MQRRDRPLERAPPSVREIVYFRGGAKGVADEGTPELDLKPAFAPVRAAAAKQVPPAIPSLRGHRSPRKADRRSDYAFQWLGGIAVGLDHVLPLSRGPHAYTRLRAYP